MSMCISNNLLTGIQIIEWHKQTRKKTEKQKNKNKNHRYIYYMWHKSLVVDTKEHVKLFFYL